MLLRNWLVIDDLFNGKLLGRLLNWCVGVGEAFFCEEVTNFSVDRLLGSRHRINGLLIFVYNGIGFRLYGWIQVGVAASFIFRFLWNYNGL